MAQERNTTKSQSPARRKRKRDKKTKTDTKHNENKNLLEGRHGQCFRLREREGVAVALLQGALRALASRADRLALVPHEHTRGVAEKQLEETKERQEQQYNVSCYNLA